MAIISFVPVFLIHYIFMTFYWKPKILSRRAVFFSFFIIPINHSSNVHRYYENCVNLYQWKQWMGHVFFENSFRIERNMGYYYHGHFCFSDVISRFEKRWFCWNISKTHHVFRDPKLQKSSIHLNLRNSKRKQKSVQFVFVVLCASKRIFFSLHFYSD